MCCRAYVFPASPPFKLHSTVLSPKEISWVGFMCTQIFDVVFYVYMYMSVVNIDRFTCLCVYM